MGLIEDTALGTKNYVEKGISNIVNGTLATVREGVAGTIKGVSLWTLHRIYDVLSMGVKNAPLLMLK